MRPDFSPAMLSFFLRARAVLAHADRVAAGAQSGKRPARGGVPASVKREKATWRKLCRLTHNQVEFAWMGRLHAAGPRARLWAMLGHFPADFGIVLTDDGGQSSAGVSHG